MKHFLLAALFFIFPLALSAQVSEAEVNKDHNQIDYTEGQAMIRIKYFFMEDKLWNGGMYAHGTFFSSFNSETGEYYPILFSYFGPRFDTRFGEVYVLSGTRNDPDGMSVTASLWYSTTYFYLFNQSLFMEWDGYFGVQGHVNRSYTQVEWLATSDELSAGICWETFATMEDWKYQSMAVGLVGYFGAYGVWGGVDFLPSREGMQSVFIRFMFTLPNTYNKKSKGGDSDDSKFIPV